MKKGVDNGEWKWYNIRARDKRAQPQKTEWKTSKKTSKKFKKGIDKRKAMWYNNKVARKEARRWSLKIEQQEMKYKAYIDMCKCERISTIHKMRILLNKK